MAVESRSRGSNLVMIYGITSYTHALCRFSVYSSCCLPNSTCDVINHIIHFRKLPLFISSKYQNSLLPRERIYENVHGKCHRYVLMENWASNILFAENSIIFSYYSVHCCKKKNLPCLWCRYSFNLINDARGYMVCYSCTGNNSHSTKLLGTISRRRRATSILCGN